MSDLYQIKRNLLHSWDDHHERWLRWLQVDGVIVKVEPPIPAMRDAIARTLTPMLDAGSGVECATLAQAAWDAIVRLDDE